MDAFLIIQWIILNIIVGIILDINLYVQTIEPIKSANLFFKLISNEFWISIEWVVLILSHKIGHLFLTSPQIMLTVYLFDYVSQMVSGIFWLKNIKIDDYVAFFTILLGIGVSITKIAD